MIFWVFALFLVSEIFGYSTEKNVVCEKNKYRSIDGSCNNLKNPHWGSSKTPYARLLQSRYGDKISTPRLAKSGKDLPSARLVLLTVYLDLQIPDLNFNINNMQHGQLITHDMSHVDSDPNQDVDYDKCCTSDGNFREPSTVPKDCFPIKVPKDDPAHSLENRTCLHFSRSNTTLDYGLTKKNQPAQQISKVNHFMDLSPIYGNTEETGRKLREFKGGRLRVDVRDGREWLTRQKNATQFCKMKSPEEACYDLEADDRNDQHPQMTILEVLWLREHNRIAHALEKINRGWDDEQLFQESRKIAIAEYQHISYYEWLPNYINRKILKEEKIIYETKDFVHDYDETVNPSVLNEHAQGAFRAFHSLIVGHLHLFDENRHSNETIRMSDWFNRPDIIERRDNFDKLIRGLTTQPELAPNPYIDSEISEYFFKNSKVFGRDLKSIDIQRERDHGLATYNDLREFCKLPRAKKFEEFLDLIPKRFVKQLATLYESPDDVDSTVGGPLERLVPDSLTGPTFVCILTEQFRRTRTGDRFWFENGNNGFTKHQLNEIRKASISRIYCDNGDHIRKMQPKGFRLISKDNEVVPCESLPVVDLFHWKD